MKILICSDGHEEATHAIHLTAPIAAALQSQVTLLGIIERQGDEAALIESLRGGLQILRDQGVEAEIIIKNGRPAEEIRKRTEEIEYDLVVIGAARSGARGLSWMSAKVYKIIRLIRAPVLLVTGQQKGLKRILICNGGKNYINSAVKMTAHFAAAGGVSVCMTHVMAEPPALFGDLAQGETNAEQLLDSTTELGRNLRAKKEALEKMDLPVEIKIRHGMVVHEILEEVRSGGYDLVVVGTALSSGPLHTYVLGDIAKEIVNRAGCSVLVVRDTRATSGWRQFWGELISFFRPTKAGR